MKILRTDNQNRTTLSVLGIVDTETAPELSRALLELDYSDLDLTLDFAGTEYITSAGLRALLVARKKLTEETMRVINVNDAIMDVFTMTGFDSLIRVESEQRDFSEQYRLSFSALLRARLETDADRTAYIYLGREYTWRDVDMASQLLAHELARQGVKKGTHVGICALNSVNWVFAFYAVAKLGGIAVLVNPGLKPAEVCTMAGIGDITHLCCAGSYAVTFEDYRDAALAGGQVRAVFDISDRVDLTARYDEYPAIAGLYGETFRSDDASVVIFSSGSTGLPKAILASSYNLMVSVEPILTETRLNRGDINLAFLPFFHIFGFATGISAGVMTGYMSVIPADKRPDTIIADIDKYKCTLFNSVPTMMLAVTQAKTFTPEKLASLRLSILGGSATTEPQMRMLRALLPNNHFGNIYGMSENAAVSLTRYEDTVEHITQTVGVPVPGLEIVLRDLATGEPVQPGEQGEICIRSDAMVICYYRLAVEKQPVDDEGWLATGDIGVLDADGYLHIVGRTKDLIICGGENISPGEIAEVLAERPELADVKVIGIPDELKGEVVGAAVVLREGASFDEEAVRAWLAERLARYKLPVYYAVFDSFPLLGSGKVDGITLKKQFTERLSR